MGTPKKEKGRMFWCNFFTLDPILFYRWGTFIFDVHFGLIFDLPFPVLLFPPNSQFYGVILDYPAPLKRLHHLWKVP